jgi:hypothetical protein
MMTVLREIFPVLAMQQEMLLQLQCHPAAVAAAAAGVAAAPAVALTVVAVVAAAAAGVAAAPAVVETRVKAAAAKLRVGARHCPQARSHMTALISQVNVMTRCSMVLNHLPAAPWEVWGRPPLNHQCL